MSGRETTSLAPGDGKYHFGNGSPLDGYEGVCSLEDEEFIPNSTRTAQGSEHSQTSVTYDGKRYVANCYLCCYSILYY